MFFRAFSTLLRSSPLLVCLLLAPLALADGIQSASTCRAKSVEPDHGAFSFSEENILPNEVEWYDVNYSDMPVVGASTWGAGQGYWVYPWQLDWDGSLSGMALPECDTVLQVIINPDNDQQFRLRIQRDIYSLPDYLFPPIEGWGLDDGEKLRTLMAAYINSRYGATNGYPKPDSAINVGAGETVLSSPGMSNPSSDGGCSSCGSTSKNGTKFAVKISLGAAVGGPVSAGQIVFNGDLTQGDLLKMENFSTQTGVGTMTGSISSGLVTTSQLDSSTQASTAAITTTLGTDGKPDTVQIVVTPQPSGSAPATTHLFSRVVAAGGLEGVRYTRTQGGVSESVAFYNTGVSSPAGAAASGVFRLVNVDGSAETWTAPPEVAAAPGVTPTFAWTADASRANGGYFAGTSVETHELIPADASQPKVVTVRTYGRIGTQSSFMRVLLSEEASQVMGTTTLGTPQVTRYGYDEVPWLFVSTTNPLGTANSQFGQRLWTLAPDGGWSLTMAQEIPALVYEMGQEVLEFYYGDPVEFSPWLDGPDTTGADLGTQAGATAFFAGLMAEARSSGWKIAGCRSSVPVQRPTTDYVYWSSKRELYVGAVKQGVEYAYDIGYSFLIVPDAVGTSLFQQPGDTWLYLSQGQERWNAGETAGTWSASGPAGYNAGLEISMDQSGVAQLSVTSNLAGGASATSRWQVAATAEGGYDESRTPPMYNVTSAHPLWSVTGADAQGRTVSEVTSHGDTVGGTVIQSISTSYTAGGGSTRSSGGVTLGSQGDAVTSGGQTTTTSTDAQGITTTTVTDATSGELISETRAGITTGYAKATNTDGSTTQTVTQTAGGATRTQSVTVTDAQGRTLSITDANGSATSYSYSADGRTVTQTLPSGGTVITTNYLDGQLKSITGTAVTPEHHHYVVNDGTTAGYEAGSITETVYYVTDSSSTWRKTTTNSLGQVLREESPSPNGSGVSVTVHTYNAKGQRMKTSAPGMADLLIAYDDFGRVSAQGYDMNADGDLTAGSIDVLSTSSTDYVAGEGTVLETVVQQQYTQDTAGSTLQTKAERKLLEGSTWQRTTQPDGTVITQWDVIDASTATRTLYAQQSVTGTQLRTQVYQNGLLMTETQSGMSASISYGYNDFGQQTQVSHPLNGTVSSTYDSLGRLHSQGQSEADGGNIVTFTYYTTGDKGLVQQVSNTDASYTTYTYDNQGRTLTQGGTAGYPLRYEYDSMGRLWKLHTYRTSATDDVTTWNYDAASGVLLSKMDAATHSVSYTYDAAGRVHTRTWQRGITTTYGYDGGGRQTSIDYSDSTPDVVITYDGVGRPVTTTDAAGAHTFTYGPTSGGRISGWTVTGTGAWSGLSQGYGYPSGQRTRSTSLGGISLLDATYGYDTATGRLSTVSASDFAVTYRYTPATGWNEGLTYTGGPVSTRNPDALKRLDNIAWTVGGTTLSSHDYTLNSQSRRTDALRQDGTAWSYGYNGRGEVTSAKKLDASTAHLIEPGKRFTFDYDGIGNRTSSKVASVSDATVLRTTGYTPNALNQYGTITHPQPGWLVLRGSINAADGGSVTIDGSAPTLTQNAGSLWFHEQSVINDDGPVRRVVDIAATRSGGGIQGGPVTTHQKGAIYIPPPTESPLYDLDGNLTSDARWIYTWDGENRLIAVEEKTGIPVVQKDASGNLVQVPAANVTRTRLEFSYDARGRRITKRILTATGSGAFALQQSLSFLYDGWNMIAEIDATTSATLLRSYEWGMDISGDLQSAGGVGGLLAVRFHAATTAANHLPPPGVHAPLYDGNGNVTELVNLANGIVSARYEYGAFGETITVDGGAVAAANLFRFCTKYLDVETGLYNYGYRYYDSVNGRWLSRDPIGIRGGVNLYGMCGNNAICYVDPYGLRTCPVPTMPPFTRPSPNTRPFRSPGYNPNSPDHPGYPGYPADPTEPQTSPWEAPLPPGTPSDAYPPQMNSAGGPSDEERQRQQDNEKERQRLRDLPKQPVPDYCKNGQCVQYAARELKRRGCNCCTLISYQTRMDLTKGPWGNIWTDTGLFGPASISSNGFHVGVACGEKGRPKNLADIVYGKVTVYDNNIPTGTTGSFWVDGAYHVVDPRTFGAITFLKAHSNNIGILKVAP